MTVFELGADPPLCVMRVTRGCDAAFTFQRVDDVGAPVDVAADVYLLVEVSKTDPTRVDQVVDGDMVSVVFPQEICDVVRNTTTWQLIRSDNPGLDTPLLVGIFERVDGR